MKTIKHRKTQPTAPKEEKTSDSIIFSGESDFEPIEIVSAEEIEPQENTNKGE